MGRRLHPPSKREAVQEHAWTAESFRRICRHAILSTWQQLPTVARGESRYLWRVEAALGSPSGASGALVSRLLVDAAPNEELASDPRGMLPGRTFGRMKHENSWETRRSRARALGRRRLHIRS
jgi:hypothetical protein